MYDDLGRTISVTTPDGAVVETEYALATEGSQIGTIITVEDQAGKRRRSITNALGQLIRVDEPDNNSSIGTLGSIETPNQPTLYSYDTLDNLIGVQQDGNTTNECGGASSCLQTRSFVYDALSRMKEATNPESGTIKYTYDENSNLKTRWDARGIKTIYDYDRLNRVLKRCYKSVGTSSLGYTTCATASGETAEANTPDVTFYYDNLTNAKGKLIKTTSAVSTTEYTSFDILGRVTASKQITDGITYGNGSTDSAMTYSYNMVGQLIEQQYPSGRKVQNIVDVNGNLEMVKSRKNANSGYWAYANNFTFSAAGAVTTMQLGNGNWESTAFNSRLQPKDIYLGTTLGGYDKLKLNYSYGDWVSGSIDATKNNGNVIQQVITVPTVGASTGFAATQKYYYDSVNRIDDSTEDLTPHGGSSSQTWRQDFHYDRYGNRNFYETNTAFGGFLKECSGSMCSELKKRMNPSIDVSNNRLDTDGEYVFDNSGNTTADPDDRTFVYDAENKQIEVKDFEDQTIGQYRYDGEGRRVKKIGAANGGFEGETTIFVYDAFGKMIAEYSVDIETTNAKVAYITKDHLGSPRINTDINGRVTSRHDYHPFGEEIADGRTSGLGYVEDTVRKQFTSYERDRETKLDFAQARYHSFTLGRFSSPDPLLSSARRPVPQSWNRYSYVINNPLKYTDPSGLDWGRRYIGNGRYQYCYAKGDKVCDGYKRIVGDAVVENARIGGRRVGTIILHQSGGYSRAIPLYFPGQQNASWISQRDAELINDVTGGLLCSVSSNLVCPNAGSKTADDVAAAGDAVQMAFFVKTLIVAGISIGAIAMAIRKNKDEVAQLASQALPEVCKIGDCKPVALAILKEFEKNGLQGQLVRLKTPNGEAIFRDGVQIAEELTEGHFGVLYRGKVYEMFTTKGTPVDKWVKQYEFRATGTVSDIKNPIFEVVPPQ